MQLIRARRAITSAVVLAAAGTLSLTALAQSSPPAGAAGGTAQAAGAVRRPPVLPDRIDVSVKVRQMITVSAAGWGSRTARLKAWQRDTSGQWVLKRGPVAVVVGFNGWVKGAQRRQSTGTTPAGKFRLPFAFGRLSDPGTPVEYRRFDANDWWPYEPRDPATYNVYQHHKAATSQWRRDYSEHLADYPGQYAYALAVGSTCRAASTTPRGRASWSPPTVLRCRAVAGSSSTCAVPATPPAVSRCPATRCAGYCAGCARVRTGGLRWVPMTTSRDYEGNKTSYPPRRQPDQRSSAVTRSTFLW